MLLNARDVFIKFVASESFGGIFLLASAILAMVVANSSLQDIYYGIIHTDFGISFGNHFIGFSVHDWVNDVLMAFFFLMVGLEIKREMIYGALNSLSKSAFPVVAAIGGMVIPGAIYYALNINTPSSHGFGIPMATDIAFALGVIMILGKKVPVELKVFLVTLAVADDLGAILVIAFFYTTTLDFMWLSIAAVITIILFSLNKLGVKDLKIYLAIGVLLWFSVHLSHIHATIAAVILAFSIPIKPKSSFYEFKQKIKNVFQDALDEQDLKQDSNVILTEQDYKKLAKISYKSIAVQSPLMRLEHALVPYSNYLIMPIFAFVNAGVSINSSFNINIDHIFLGIFLGLVVGKPLGIFISTYILTKLNFIQKPSSVTWLHIVGAGMLAGIGFTMSIFVSNLAFSHEESKDVAKVAILIASLCSCIIGALFLSIYDKIRK